jgi:hypothetical protein
MGRILLLSVLSGVAWPGKALVVPRPLRTSRRIIPQAGAKPKGDRKRKGQPSGGLSKKALPGHFRLGQEPLELVGGQGVAHQVTLDIRQPWERRNSSCSSVSTPSR